MVFNVKINEDNVIGYDTIDNDVVVDGLVMLPLKQVTDKFVFPRATTTVAQLLKSKSNDKHVLNGWIDRKPKQLSKNLTFALLRDQSGDLIQLIDTTSPSKLKSLKPDSTISVQGHAELKGDRPDFNVAEINVLNNANLLPGQLKETKDWPAQYRYIQLRQPEMQSVLKRRAGIVQAARKVLDANEFVEIETPLLFKSTPEGAREFLVPTRKKGKMYALPQSPQQYKQLLIASGVNRYYQVAKCFRDEDLRADRQPEFTQIDLEMGFANSEDVKSVIQQVAKAVWKQFAATELRTIKDSPSQITEHDQGSFGTLTYEDAIAKYGIDKPDLRSSIQITTLPAVAKTNKEYPVFEAIVLDGPISPELTNDLHYKARKPIATTFESEDQIKSVVQNLADVADWPAFFAALGAKPGDFVAFSDRRAVNYENPTPLGRLRQVAIDAMPSEYRATDMSVACWVQKFPLFEPSVAKDGDYPVYDLGSLKATHHPFTMVDLADYDQLATDPLACHGQHFDLVVDGVEVGGGSTRVHDADLQRYIFENVLKITNHDKLFGHLLAALATGCPPHAGMALGLDRLVAMVCGYQSVRDVIAFPKTITGADPMIGSPSAVSKDQLAPYHVSVR